MLTIGLIKNLNLDTLILNLDEQNIGLKFHGKKETWMEKVGNCL